MTTEPGMIRIIAALLSRPRPSVAAAGNRRNRIDCIGNVADDVLDGCKAAGGEPLDENYGGQALWQAEPLIGG